MSLPRDIALMTKAHRMLAEAITVDQIVHVENLAQRARDYAKRAGLGRENVNAAAKLMLLSRRKLGSTLSEMRERGELAPEGRPSKKLLQAATVSISDLGIDKFHAHRCLVESEVPDDKFEEWSLRVAGEEDKELTAAALRRYADELRRGTVSEQQRAEITTPDAIEKLRAVMDKVQAWWPSGTNDILASVLRSIAGEIERGTEMEADA